jgi:hypothetical protein
MKGSQSQYPLQKARKVQIIEGIGTEPKRLCPSKLNPKTVNLVLVSY